MTILDSSTAPSAAETYMIDLTPSKELELLITSLNLSDGA